MYILSTNTLSALTIVDCSIRTKIKQTTAHVTGAQQKPLQAFEKLIHFCRKIIETYITYCFSYLILLHELTAYILYQSN